MTWDNSIVIAKKFLECDFRTKWIRFILGVCLWDDWGWEGFFAQLKVLLDSLHVNAGCTLDANYGSSEQPLLRNGTQLNHGWTQQLMNCKKQCPLRNCICWYLSQILGCHWDFLCLMPVVFSKCLRSGRPPCHESQAILLRGTKPCWPGVPIFLA